MKNITIYTTRIEISNYELGECVDLEKMLSVWNPVTFSVEFTAFQYRLSNKTLIIPAGINRSKLEQFFPGSNIIDNSQTEPYNQTKFSLKYPPRNTMQFSAINFLLKPFPQRFLSLETGGGKTYCAIHYVFKTKKMPIVFVDQELILNQWKDRILFFTNIQEEEIFIIQGTNSINKLMKMNDKELKKYKFFLALHRTLSSNELKETGYSTYEIFKKIGVGVRLYDEAHVEMKNIFAMDIAYNCESIYITATPKRSNPSENKVYQNMFNITQVPRYIGKSDNYHNIIILPYNTNPSLQDEISMKTKYGFDANAYSSYILENNDAYDTFYDSLKKILDKSYNKNKHKGIILFKTTAICDDFYEAFKDYLYNLNNMNLTVGKYHYKVKNKENELEKDIIFTTDKSMQKAIDIKGLSLVINTVPCSSETVVTQMIGRLRKLDNKEVFFVDMYDEGFSAQRNQASKRLRLYKKKAKQILKIK